MVTEPEPHRQAQPLSQELESDLHDWLATLVGARILIAVVTVAVLVASLVYYRLGTPIYRADTLLQVEEKRQSVPGLDDVLGGLRPERSTDTEIEILRSRSLLAKVIGRLNLDVIAAPRRFPFIGGAIARSHRGTTPSEPMMGFRRYAWGGEVITVPRLDVPAELEGEALVLVAGEAGRYRLQTRTGALLLEGVAGKAAGAEGDNASGVKLFVSELRARKGTQFFLTKQPLQDAIERLQKALVLGEKGKKTGIIRVELTGPDIPVLTSTLDELADLYVRQNVERKSEEAERTLQFVNSQLPELRQSLDKAEDALNAWRSKHGTIDLPLEAKAAIERAVDVEKVRAELQMQRAELSQKFTDSHPFVVALDKKLAEADRERASINARIKNLPASELESVRLLRDVKVNNELYVLLLNKAQELRVVKSGTIGNVRILDRAMPPRKPSFPSLNDALSLGLLLGLLLGVVAAFAKRALSRGIDDPEILETVTGLGVFASVPRSESHVQYTRHLAKGAKSAGPLAKRDPDDLSVESLRSLRTSLQFALIDAPNHVVVICGPSPSVGKSFISSNLAQVLADSGKRVLLVDADLRAGAMHRVFGTERGPGLSEVLAGAVPFENVVLRNISPNLDLLVQGMIPPNPSELLLSPRFKDLLERASKEYDLVVVDTPPILAVTDSAIVSKLGGVLLLVLRAGQHPLREIKTTLGRFAQSGLRPNGLVLNDVTHFGGAYDYGYHYQYDYRNKKKAS